MEEIAEVVAARQKVIALRLGKKPQNWFEQLFFPSGTEPPARVKSILLIVGLLSFFFFLWRRKKAKEKRERDRETQLRKEKDRAAGVPDWDYEKMRGLVKNEKLPAMFVEQNIMNRNIQRMAHVARAHGKTIRLATKSIRVPAIIDHILKEGKGIYRGLMCFSVEEAYLLSQHISGDKDFLIAYPTVQPAELDTAWDMIVHNDCKVTLMIDSIAHVKLLDAFWGSKCNKAREEGGDEKSQNEGDKKCSICIDVDMSYRPFGSLLHLGVHRSPIRTLDDLREVVEAVQGSTHLRLSGIMGYDAQIAGLPDDNPYNNVAMELIIRWIKYYSRLDVSRKRKEIFEYLQQQGIKLDFINGGGTGSLEASCKEDWLTEVTVGSGVLQSSLFDYYRDNQNFPAFCFALRVTRVAEPRAIVCQSGGFVASGDASEAKQPSVFLPEGLYPFANEGWGEVQTPFIVTKQLWNSPLCPGLGDPVFVRSAKAGEIAEHFAEYCVIDLHKNAIVNRVKTYRGLGWTCY